MNKVFNKVSDFFFKYPIPFYGFYIKTKKDKL